MASGSGMGDMAEVHPVPEEPELPADVDSNPSNPAARHQCYICSRTYERQDHLSRHIKSHENERAHRCPDCGKGFNRPDLLNRHRAAHTKSAGEHLRRRTGRACYACIKAKTKCDEQRPCKRCQSRNILCHEDDSRRSTRTATSSSHDDLSETTDKEDGRYADEQSGEAHPSQILMSAETPAVVADRQVDSTYNPDHATLLQPMPEPPTRYFEDANLLLGLHTKQVGPESISARGALAGPELPLMHATYHETKPFNQSQSGHAGESWLHAQQAAGAAPAPLPFPDFFEQIMMADPASYQYGAAPLPPNVGQFMSDFSFEALDFDFSFLSDGLTRPPTAQGHQLEPDGGLPAADALAEPSKTDAYMRSEALKRNPWSWNEWIPERNSHTFSEQDTIDVHRDRVDTNDQLTSPSGLRLPRCDLTHADRDRMIRTITQTAQSRLSISSFPSLELLEDIIDLYLLQDSSTIESFVHAATFVPKDTCAELLLAAVSAGARFIALPEVWRMGFVIQEVVRLAIANLLESDNTATRRLQPVQALILMVDIGVWSGFRRKAEIAISFLGPPVTMITWSKMLTRAFYQDWIPDSGDRETALSDKWRGWAEREGRKRLVLRTFILDAQIAIVHLKNQSLSPSQLHIPLPACRDLWLAPNAEAWSHLHGRIAPPRQADTPTLVDVFGNVKLLDQYATSTDVSLCLLAACHAIGHAVYQFRSQARLLAHRQDHSRQDRWLDHQRLQSNLLDDLRTMHLYCDMNTKATPEIMLTIEILITLLHVDLEEIQTFSGKLGEDEARRAYPKILAWTQVKESRMAVWHAGQVFRIARTFERTRLRDFYAVSVYHAALTLWVYGMVTRNTRRHEPKAGIASMAEAFHHSATNQHILIDADDLRAAEAFVRNVQGSACVRGPDGFSIVSLSDSKSLMATAESILKSNFPASQNGLPPLIENLANLMGELGRLSGRD